MPLIPSASASAAASSIAAVTSAESLASSMRSTSSSGTAAPTAAGEVLSDPAGVLGALVRVDEIDDVPGLLLLAGGERRAQRLLGLGPMNVRRETRS